MKAIYTARLWLSRKTHDLAGKASLLGERLGDWLYHIAGKIDPSPRPVFDAQASLTAMLVADLLKERAAFIDPLPGNSATDERVPNGFIRIRRPARYRNEG